METWKAIFDWGSVILVGLTMVFGAGALVSGNVLNERQAKEIEELRIDLEKQKQATADAQAELLRLQQQRLPRVLKFETNESLQALIASLRRKPLSATIVFKKNDSEASWFADDIWGLLGAAGWKVPRPSPIPDELASDAVGRLKAEPQGVTLITKTIDTSKDPTLPINILKDLFTKSLGDVAVSADPTMPDNAIKIVVLQKP